MKLVKGFLILIVSLLFFSCEEVINVDLDTAPPRLVIDASIDWMKNTPGNEQRIKLSTTTGYFSPDFPSVSGATISVTNSKNVVFDFLETANKGEYVCTDFVPVIGEKYSLTVLLNGQSYTASETLIEVPEIDETIVQNSEGGMTGDELEIQYSFQDDGSKDNYYLSGIDVSSFAFPAYSVESDEQFQGKKMTQYYSHEDLKAGDSLNIKLYGVSKSFFAYFKKILLAAGGDSGPFPATPTAVRGNIVNQSDSKNYAYGYFRLSEVSSRDYTMK